MNHRLIHAIAIASMVAANSSHASANTVFQVPEWGITIQEAIDLCDPGDEIVVGPGTYHEAINFLGKAVNVHSSGGAAVTILDGTGLSTSIVRCVSGEGPGTILDGFTITNGSAGSDHIPPNLHTYGFGMYVQDSGPTVKNCIFTNNGTNSTSGSNIGGGLTVFGGSGTTITNCQFTNNVMNPEYSSNTAGGIYCKSQSNMTISGCSFVGNAAQIAGGMEIELCTNPTVSNCAFTNNIADTADGQHGQGGGLFMYFCDGGLVTNSQFTNNRGGHANAGGGGGLHVEGCSTTFSNCAFTGNQAAYGAGMAIHNPNITKPSPTVVGCTFMNNDSSCCLGGGVSIENAKPLIRDCTFSGNSAGSWGGAIRCYQSGPVIANCLIINNSAVYRGAGIYAEDTFGVAQVYYPVVTNCTIVGNTVNTGSLGAGVYMKQVAAFGNTPIRISNCIIRGNTGLGGNPNVQVQDNSFAGWNLIRNSNVQGSIVGNYMGSGNIDADPMFVDAANGNYRLQAGSPCIDTGHHWDLVINGIANDKDGDPRIQDGTGDGTDWADMGAYEYQGTAGTLGVFPLPKSYWHFNNFTGTGPIPADIGAGTIDLSTWGGNVGTGPGAFFDINRVNDTPAGNSLKLIQGAGGNNTAIKVNFPMTGYQGLKVTFVCGRGPSGAGGEQPFNSGTWEWSTNGTTFTPVAGVNTCPSSLTVGFSALQTVDLSGVTALNNAPSVTLRHTLSGATGNDRYITIDNLQLNATPIPLPCVGDVTGNHTVNIDDLVQVITHWGSTSPGPWDVNGNGVVNIDDLVAVITHWGSCP